MALYCLSSCSETNIAGRNRHLLRNAFRQNVAAVLSKPVAAENKAASRLSSPKHPPETPPEIHMQITARNPRFSGRRRANSSVGFSPFRSGAPRGVSDQPARSRSFSSFQASTAPEIPFCMTASLIQSGAPTAQRSEKQIPDGQIPKQPRRIAHKPARQSAESAQSASWMRG